MGHLSNPIGFRLSYKKRWKDIWFVKNLYYPEYVNNILNIRDYLYFYLSSKDMLESGFCISHFYLIKINKLYTIKIFIYQIDMEKSSYEYTNLLFKSYYENLKKYTYIDFRNKNKSKNEVKINRFRSYISNLHNADYFIYYYLYYLYFAKMELPNIKNYLYNNKFMQNKKFSKYTNSIIKLFMKLIKDRLKYICVKKKNKLYGKNLILIKLKKDRINKLWKIIFPLLFKYENKKKLKKEEYKILDNFQNEEFENSLNKNLKNYMFSKKKGGLYKIFLTKSLLVNEPWKDEIFFKNKKIRFLDFIFFLAKKVNFKRYKSMIKLDEKWNNLVFYIKLFQYNSYIIRRFKNMKLFFYYMYIFIFLCKDFSKNRLHNKDFVNIRELLYFIIYTSIGYKSFFKVFNELTIFLKFLFSIFLYKIEINNIFFIFYFMSNKNVTTHLISKYIGVRLQKNFTLLKTLNPLRRELKRVYKDVVIDQKFFTIYNYKYLYYKKKFQYKQNIIKCIKIFKKIFKIFFYKYYKKFKNFLIFNIIKYNKKNLYFKLNYFKKIFSVNLYYKFLLENFLIFKNLSNNKKALFNNIFFYIFYIIKINMFPKSKKLFNNKLIIQSSYFYKNYINFKYLKFIWVLYKKFNFRRIRDTYIPKYKSIIMGYKMAFRGRFSRKQRASFIWLHNGKVPLNTLKNDIDYSFLIVPLKNSVISIKIWFYLNKNHLNYKYILKI